ncbi:MAG TPA: sensor domain-containing diguanylate cyclase [Patescibacteria group bacterium]|nr:sensor domain-containing diguanylate cyclase [Patescibacteria group bacterium]
MGKKHCKNKVQCLLIGAALLAILLMFYDNYQDTLQLIQEEHRVQRELVEKNITAALEQADLASRLVDAQVRQEKEMILRRLSDRYRQNQDILSWDLAGIRQEIQPYHFYVIDDRSRIVRTTDAAELGMDFSIYPYFDKLLTARRQSGSFVSERLEVSQDGQLKTYGYLPTEDQRYLLEVGLDFREKFVLPEQGNLATLVSLLSRRYPLVDDVHIYRLSKQGELLRSMLNRNSDSGMPVDIDSTRELVGTVLRERKIQEFSSQKNSGDSKKTIRYIPYQSQLRDGKIDWGNSFVVAITYNNQQLSYAMARHQRALCVNVLLILLVFGGMLFGLNYLLRQVEASREQLASIINLTSEGYCRLGPDLQFEQVNEAMCRMTGYSEAELLAILLPRLITECDEEVEATVRPELSLDDIESWKNKELVLLANGGRRMFVVVNATVVRDSDGQVRSAFAFIHDVTNRKVTEEYVRRMAYHDPLTDLPNRKLFYEKMQQELARCRRNDTMLAVLFVDMDRFKFVNDTYGHETGDLLLCEVARRLHSIVRESDMVARLGGDEFTLIVTDLQDENDVSAVANKVLEVFQKPAVIRGQALVLQCSVGVSVFPRDDQQAEGLLRKADAAMYRAKKHGRNRWQVFKDGESELLS